MRLRPMGSPVRWTPSASPEGRSSVLRRVAHGAAAFALGDLLVGCTIFSILVLAILEGFAVGWIRLVGVYAAHGAAFGTVDQSRSAWALLFVNPPFAVLAGYLGLRSLRLPIAWWRVARGRGPAHPQTDGLQPPRHVPMSEGALWAVRARPTGAGYRYVSLLLPGN